MLSDFMDGLVSYLQAWRLITKMKLWSYMIIPGVISLILGVSIFGVAYSFSDELAAYLNSFWPTKVGFKVVSTATSILSKLFSGLIGFVGFKNVILVVNSPFMSQLSEKIEERLSGRKAPNFDLSRFFKEFKRAIRVTIRSFTREMWYSLVALVLGKIIGLAILTVFVVQAYFAGAGNLDYVLERHLSVEDSNRFVKQHKGLAIGNGMVYIALLLIPGVGLIFGPSLSTIAATVESLERVDKFKYALDELI